MARSERSLNFGSDGKRRHGFKNNVLSRQQLRLPKLMGSAEFENEYNYENERMRRKRTNKEILQISICHSYRENVNVIET